MLFGLYFLLLGSGIASAAPNPDKLMMTTTDVSAIRLGHAAANAGALLGPDAKPPKMRHLCKNMQKAVQNTATRLLTIIGISVPSLSGTTPVPEGRLSRIHFSYHKVISVPVIEPALALEAGHSQDGTVMHHHEVHKFHKDGQPRGPFLHRVHRALMTLGPWEGRMVAFVLGCGIGVLLRMVWVLAVLLVRGARGSPEREETLLVYAEEIVPLYTETDEKKFTNNGEN
ncbi:hypothetical protein DFH94DRAFT_777826 [Russula ochroleuca]|jgi:hypothetical protein|uniref:Uncharacterized protein n=1 Tax=Russula ochroleuca TaxID=152965 RepID=A0A9P5MLJ7_9AGAM|nr:hypothetical protein DFH94DRAFT_777826 [Russula ochroleuca]